VKALITGIAGFIGSSVAESLIAHGWRVFGIDSLHSGYQANIPPGVEWQRADIRTSEAWSSLPSSFDAIIHLAAQTSGEKSFEDPAFDLQTNLEGTFRAYEFARKCQASRFINMSSMSVYGAAVASEPITEEYSPNPASPYGNSKLAAERLLNLLSNKDGLPVTHLRLFNAYGPKQDLNEMKQGMVSIYLSYFLNHPEVIVKGSLSRVRDFIYIDDIVNAIRKLSENPIPPRGTFNLCTGRTTTVADLLQTIRSITGIDKPQRIEASTNGDIQGFAGSTKLLWENCGIRSTVSLREGLTRMFHFYRGSR
jgi:UDP-glucose 4-epimerase